MKKIYLPFFSALLVLVFSATVASSRLCAQVQITDSVNLESLVNDVLLGGDLSAFNITYNGMPVEEAQSNQYGTFEILNSAFPISEGAILGTGRVGGFGGDISYSDGNYQDDADLIALSGAWIVNNCAIIEFDIIAVSDTFLIDYIFASEEYPGWTCSVHNDVFGLFISGPGLEGPFLNDAVNIALIPDSDTPIGINTVNSGYPSFPSEFSYCLAANPNFQEDSIFFMRNTPPLENSIATPGHTHMFTAFASLIPGQTYHIKFATGNAMDNALQSAVFLRKSGVSSQSGLNPLEISVNPDNIVVSPEGLFIAGTFNYFIPEPMVLDVNGNYIFEAMVASDMNVTYKFFNGNGPDSEELVEEECGISGVMNDLSRYVLMPNEPLSLETVCFGTCDELCALISSNDNIITRQPGIFPNPSAGTVQIVLAETGRKQVLVQVYDLTGKKVLERNIASESGEIYTLDINSLRSGVYVMQITSGGTLRTEKLVKQ